MPVPRKRVCPIETVIDLCSERWTLNIIFCLMHEQKRFSTLLNELDGVSKKTLTIRLRTLEERGIVQRTAFKESPPRVEYSLTELGKSFQSVFDGMSMWGSKYVKYQMNCSGYFERPREVFFQN